MQKPNGCDLIGPASQGFGSIQRTAIANTINGHVRNRILPKSVIPKISAFQMLQVP